MCILLRNLKAAGVKQVVIYGKCCFVSPIRLSGSMLPEGPCYILMGLPPGNEQMYMSSLFPVMPAVHATHPPTPPARYRGQVPPRDLLDPFNYFLPAIAGLLRSLSAVSLASCETCCRCELRPAHHVILLRVRWGLECSPLPV